MRDLSIGFAGRHGGVDIVDDMTFDVRPGEVLGLVGESGCGKSLTSLAVMGLLPQGARVRGEILFAGTDLLTMSTKRAPRPARPRHRDGLPGRPLAR